MDTPKPEIRMRFIYCAIWLAVPTPMHAHHGPGQFDSFQSLEG